MTTTLRKDEVFDALTTAGWPVKTMRWEMDKPEYCLPSRTWVKVILPGLWTTEFNRMKLVMVPGKYNCVDIAQEVRAWVVRADAVNAKVPCARLFGLVRFVQRTLQDRHVINWTLVNDNGKLSPMFFDAQLFALYAPDADEIASFYSGYC